MIQMTQNEEDILQSKIVREEMRYDYTVSPLFSLITYIFGPLNKRSQMSLFMIATKLLNIEFPRACQRHLDLLYWAYETSQYFEQFREFFAKNVICFNFPSRYDDFFFIFIKIENFEIKIELNKEGTISNGTKSLKSIGRILQMNEKSHEIRDRLRELLCPPSNTFIEYIEEREKQGNIDSKTASMTHDIFNCFNDLFTTDFIGFDTS